MKQLTILFIAILLFSCKQEEGKIEYSVINGNVTNNAAETAIIQGNDFEARIPIVENGSFSDTLHLKNNGFYQLFIGPERTSIYLEKGHNLEVNLDAEEFDETLKYSGSLASINNFLAAKYLWNEKNLSYKDLFSLDEEEFIKKIEANKNTMDSLYASFQVKNENFDKINNDENKYAKAFLIESYQGAHVYYTKNEDFTVSEDFYSPLKNINYSDTLAFRNSTEYRRFINTHFNRIAQEEAGDQDPTIAYLNKVDNSLPDGYAKDQLMMGHLQYGLKPDENLDRVFEIFKNANKNPENLATVTQRYELLKALTPGNPSPTFNYENYKGGTTSLADLKGKYTYIDVWATWCGPCLREIPSLQEIEKDYTGKNIQIVSISIDEEKDYDKWREMVEEKSLGGIQLMADNNWSSKFVQDYAILGIPRFILVDPEGNIVSADAPRPSDPQLREMLNKLL